MAIVMIEVLPIMLVYVSRHIVYQSNLVVIIIHNHDP